MHTHTRLQNSIFDGPVTNLLSVLGILLGFLFTCSYAKGGKAVNDFKLGTFVGCFQSDGAESMAVKGLKERKIRKSDPPSQ